LQLGTQLLNVLGGTILVWISVRKRYSDQMLSIDDSGQTMLHLQLMLIDISANDNPSDWQTDVVMLSVSTDHWAVKV